MKIHLSLSLVAFLATGASATTLTLQGLALGSNAQMNVSGSGLFNGTVFAGPENASLDGGPSIRVFCADLAHLSNSNVTSVTLVDTSTAGTNWQLAAKLYNKYSPTVGNNTFDNAALQVAIWRAIFPSATITDGDTSGVSAAANILLASDLTGISDQATYYDMGGANQSMLGGYQPVPEPASMAALGLGALGLLKRGKRS
jgi:hypothetical protein